MGDDLWGPATARRYDASVSEMFEPSVLGPTVDVLADLAGGRAALEFAIGTGRVALPLSERGVPVSGIELSVPMLDVLARKPGADRIEVTVGDMATARAPGRGDDPPGARRTDRSPTSDSPGAFGLVYLVFNTITNLLGQDEQVACFENAAAHLVAGGYFLIETIVPDLRRLPPGERHVVFDRSPGHAGIDEYDTVAQLLVSHHYTVDANGDGRHDRAGTGRVSSSQHRYAWPAEYDLMARIAGLELRHRWADWHRNPFTADSTSHVSVWQRSAR